MQYNHCGHKNGFTLLEVLIALFIFTVIGLMLTQTLHTVMITQESIHQSATELTALQTTLLIFSQDLKQVLDPSILAAQGIEENSFSGSRYQLSFIHFDGNWQTQSLKRSCYHREIGQLIRDTWLALNKKQQPPHRQILIDPIQQLEFRYLDNKKKYHSSWPPENNDQQLPQAVAIRLHFQHTGTLEQLYPLPQQQVIHASP